MAKIIILLFFCYSAFAHEDHSKNFVLNKEIYQHGFDMDFDAFIFTEKKTEEFYRNVAKKHNRKKLKMVMNPDYKKISTTITKEKMLKVLNELSGGTSVLIGNRSLKITERSSDKNRKLTAEYLVNYYKGLGLEAKILKSKSGFSTNYNVQAIMRGSSSQRRVIISSHSDSVGNSGANDDGSGTMGVMLIAEALKDYVLTNDVYFVHFDREERGLVGSKAYVKALSENDKKSIIGNIQFEMMGTNKRKDGAFHIVACDDEMNLPLKNALINTIAEYQLDIVNNPGCTTRSDHSSFWDVDVAAVAISENFFGGDSDSCYHKKCDVVDARLDYNYMKQITIAVFGAVLRLVK